MCFNQCGNADESWLYPLEVGQGMLDECFEVLSVGSERSTVGEHSLQDAGRMMWGARASLSPTRNGFDDGGCA